MCRMDWKSYRDLSVGEQAREYSNGGKQEPEEGGRVGAGAERTDASVMT